MEYDKAIADFNTAIELDSDYANPYYGRALVYDAADMKAEAIADLEKCIDLSQRPFLTQAAEQKLDELHSQP